MKLKQASKAGLLVNLLKLTNVASKTIYNNQIIKN